MARWLRARALLLALVAVLLVGCAPSGNSTEVFCDRTSPGYCESLQDAGAGDAVRPGAQNWSAMELRRGSAVELFEVQAPADTRHPAVTSWRPDFQTTAVIVVDRSRTDVQITGWRDLAAAGLPVSFSRQSVDSWLLITAMSWGLADSLRPHPSALHLLGDLHRAGLLEPTPPDEPLGTPLSIAFSHQVADRIAAGENLEIVVPAEGTLSYVKGLASADELPPAGRLPDLLPDLLAEHGYRAPDAPAPEGSRLVSGAEVDYPDGVRAQTRRVVWQENLLHSADDREHTLTPVLMIVVLVAWISGLARRGSQPSVRRAAMGIGALSALWLGFRMLKYVTANRILDELLWYAFYLPMLVIPACLLWLAWAVDRPDDNGRPPPWWWALIGLDAVLLGLVMTNGAHELVFDLVRDPETGASIGYTYQAGYAVVALAAGVPLLAAVAKLAVKSHRVPGRHLPWLPEAIVLAMAAYLVGYALEVPIVRQTDLTLVLILCGIALVEAAVRTGTLPLNTGYERLFRASSLDMRIVDERSGDELSAEGTEADTPDADLIRFSAPIRGGHVAWSQDISAVATLQRDSAVAVNRLRTLHAMLSARRSQDREIVAARVRADLLHEMETEVGARVDELDELIAALPAGPVDRRALSRIALRACFVKRRAALFFQLQTGEAVSADTVNRHLAELAELAEPAGLRSTVRCLGPIDTPVHHPGLLYECVFRLIDTAVSTECQALVGQVSLTPPRQELRVLLPAPFADLGFDADLRARLDAVGAIRTLRPVDESFTLSISVPRPEDGDDG